MPHTDQKPVELPAPDVFSRACSSRDALQHLTGRWGALTIVALHQGGEAMRFSAIRRRIEGVSDRMLSQTLGQLERDGIVKRTVHSTLPPNVDYELTAVGDKIAAPLAELTNTVEAVLPQVLEAQQTYDAAETKQSPQSITR